MKVRITRVPKYQGGGLQQELRQALDKDGKLKDYTLVDSTNKNMRYPVESQDINQIVATAIGMGYDPKQALAVALQETGIRRSDDNIFHIKHYPDDMTESEYLNQSELGIRMLKDKASLARKLGYTSPRMQLQAYNGFGKIGATTEGSQKSFYGVPIPPEGIDMKKNPLYGTRILDLKKNVIDNDPYVNSTVDRYNKFYANPDSVYNTTGTLLDTVTLRSSYHKSPLDIITGFQDGGTQNDAYALWFKYNTREGKKGMKSDNPFLDYDMRRYYDDMHKGIVPYVDPTTDEHYVDDYKFPSHRSFSVYGMEYTNPIEYPDVMSYDGDFTPRYKPTSNLGKINTGLPSNLGRDALVTNKKFQGGGSLSKYGIKQPTPPDFSGQDNLRRPQFIDPLTQTTPIPETPIIHQNNTPTVDEQQDRLRKNTLYQQTHPYTRIDENGNLSQIDPERGFDGQPLSPRAKAWDKGLDHIMGAIDAASVATGVGEVAALGYKALKSHLVKRAGKIVEKIVYELGPPTEGIKKAITEQAINNSFSNREGFKVIKGLNEDVHAKQFAENTSKLNEIERVRREARDLREEGRLLGKEDEPVYEGYSNKDLDAFVKTNPMEYVYGSESADMRKYLAQDAIHNSKNTSAVKDLENIYFKPTKHLETDKVLKYYNVKPKSTNLLKISETDDPSLRLAKLRYNNWRNDTNIFDAFVRDGKNYLKDPNPLSTIQVLQMPFMKSFNKMGGTISQMGYRDDSPYRGRKRIDIYTPNGMIDMSNTGIPLMANGRYLPPYSGMHQFNTDMVTETPMYATGGRRTPFPNIIDFLYGNEPAVVAKPTESRRVPNSEPIEENTAPSEQEALEDYQRRQEALNLINEPEENVVQQPDEERSEALIPNVNNLTSEQVLQGIADSEGGTLGQSTGLGEGQSALGTYQITDATRETIRKQHFPNMSSEEFEQRFKTDSVFESQVAMTHLDDLIKKYGQEGAIQAWYTGHAGGGDVIPHPEAGNTSTVNDYTNKVLRNIAKHKYKDGGSFRTALRAARRSNDNEFTWNGGKYNIK